MRQQSKPYVGGYGKAKARFKPHVFAGIGQLSGSRNTRKKIDKSLDIFFEKLNKNEQNKKNRI